MAYYGAYVSVAQKAAKAKKEMEKLRKAGQSIYPVEIEGRLIARSFRGKRWCEHLESFSDYANRLPRGRTYARNGSVCHLEISEGLVKALVSGSSMYKVQVTIAPLNEEKWSAVKAQCAGQIASMLELLKGQLSDQVMKIVVDRDRGLFPRPRWEIQLACSCPDGARMCKHVAAVLYGVGHRLDTRPDLLFVLRGVDPLELLSTQMALPDGAGDDLLDDSRLADIFGIDLDEDFQPEAGEPAGPEEPWTGQSILQLRQRLGLTAPAFAKLLGVTPASVSRWESLKGEVKLRATTRAALDKARG